LCDVVDFGQRSVLAVIGQQMRRCPTLISTSDKTSSDKYNREL
jgi:hypothetical protein